LNIIFDIQSFIEKTEIQLVRYKTEGKKYFYDFDLLFENRNIAENTKRYFEGKGYKVEIKWCKSCSGNVSKCDIIIEILN
jgi:hypothetical protein